MKPDRVAAVLLAAGAGSRFGGGKLDAILDGRLVGARSLESLGGRDWLAYGIVVPETVPAFAASANPALIHNPLAATGMASSLHCAVGFAREHGAQALLIALADMPFVSPGTIGKLLEAHDGSAEAVAAVRYPSGVPGAPAMLGSGCFEALLEVEGDRGAGGYLASRHVTIVEVEPNELRDIDRPGDLDD